MNNLSKVELYFQSSITDRNLSMSMKVRAKLLRGLSQEIAICNTPEDLLHHPWFQEIIHEPEPRKSDLCIVLEDMSLEWVEILGPMLSIPVSVFALHWANPIDHVGGDVRVPIGESPARHFILNYRQSLPFSILEREHYITLSGRTGVKKGWLKKYVRLRAKIVTADFI